MNDNLLEVFYTLSEEKQRLELAEKILEEYEYYIDLILNNILNNKELRNNAYLLNIMSKKKRVVEYLKNKFNKAHFNILVNDSDPKTRKNTYIFMGNYCDSNYLIELIKCLKSETTNYCISSLILSLGNYKIKNLNDIMVKYLELLDTRLANQEIEEVHYRQIKDSINKVLAKNVKLSKHTFIGLKKEEKLFLTCMEPLINATFADVKKSYGVAEKYKNGIIIKCNDLDEVFKIRTFYEALIIHKEGLCLSFDLVQKNIIDFLKSKFLEDTHLEKTPFLYRIEYVSNKNKQDKLNIYDKVNNIVRDNFKDKYVNNPSNYEFEIRIVDNEDKYDVFYKLYTYQDKRFDYREKDLPASINPVSAAIMLKEVDKYLKENSKVLDPFCGTSTMLIERSYLSGCDLTGVDISSVAIDYSKINTRTAKVKVNLIQQNCLNHQGYYNEIISNMPYGNRVGTHRDNELLYKGFLNRISTLLLDGGVAILLTSEISLIKNLLKVNTKLKLVKDIYTETGGLTPHLFVIKKV